MQDSFGRTIDYLRISVTDRCNLRCVYCMPEEGVDSLSHTEILSYEEIMRLVRSFAELGVKKIRLTGGEPLVRKGIESLVRDIKNVSGIENVSITTNGILLAEKLPALIEAGLDGANISLDTLDASKYERITRRSGIENVLSAIDLCASAGLNTKVNCVAMRGVNDDEFCDLAALAKDRNICVRFIEYMPVGKNDYEKAVSADEIKDMLSAQFGELAVDDSLHGNGPAVYVKPSGFAGSIGVISAMSNCFCSSCNRVRLTAEGFLKLCLQYNVGLDLRELLRNGTSDSEIREAILNSVYGKPREHVFNDYSNAENVEENGMSRIGG